MSTTGNVGQFRVRLDAAADFDPVQVGQPDVQEDQAGQVLLGKLETFGAGGGRPHGVAADSEEQFEGLEDVRIIIDQQNQRVLTHARPVIQWALTKEETRNRRRAQAQSGLLPLNHFLVLFQGSGTAIGRTHE